MSAITQNKRGLTVLFTGSILQLFFGLPYVWSVFVGPVSEFYSWDVDGVKLTSSFMLGFLVVGILLGGKLQQKIGAQKVALLGGLTLAAGMLATAFLPLGHGQLMYLTYGIAGGFGVGAGYNAIITASQKWFPQNRGFSTGVSVCAFGLSTVIFAPLIETFIKQFGLRNTFLILAGASCVATLALFGFIRLPEGGAAAGTPAAALLAKKQYTVTQAIRKKEFYLITLSLMFATSVFFVLNPSFKLMAAERGLGASVGTAVVMLTGVANALGRLAAPLLSDKIGREKAAMSIILLTSLCAFLLCFAQGYAYMAVIAAAAFCYGGYSGVYPILTADYFGIQNVGANYGAVMVGFAISALTFPAMIGLIGSVAVRFVVLGCLAFAGVVMVLLLLRSKKKTAEE